MTATGVSIATTCPLGSGTSRVSCGCSPRVVSCAVMRKGLGLQAKGLASPGKAGPLVSGMRNIC